MNDHERREQAEALLKRLELGQEDIRQGRYVPVEELFSEIEAVDNGETYMSRDQ
ncbi:hypothetical protein [Paraburkholderia ferrariae]|uniref:hypothetical protein n=1 Tax=Paraburkholderia ferrariae TaxID=386056 RepID=UPI0012EBB873|nr:hypothetical protein [Paraburkholderia ferrariae]